MLIIVPSTSPINVTVTTLSASTISVTWQPVPIRERNGIITEYNITYNANQWMHINTIQVTSREMSVILNSLIPFTTYNITVKAATTIGFGPDSEDAVATTFQAGKIL